MMNRFRHTTSSFVLSVLGLGTGCIFGGSSSGSGTGNGTASDTSDSDTSGPDIAELEACRGDASDAEVDDTILIVDDYNQSLHEMVVCGGLAVQICSGVVDGIIDAIIEQRNDATPKDWTYEGEGVYRTGGAGTDMTTKFYLAEDFEFGRAGDLVTQNLFLVDSYLVGAVLEVDFSTGAAQIVYDEPGPLVELLGRGTDPQNPMPVDINDLSDLKAKLGQLEFEANVIVDDMQSASIVQYELDTPRQSAAALVGGAAMEYELVEATAYRAELEQDLAVDNWDVDFVSGGAGALDGTIDFTVTGQHFDFAGTMVYEASAFADPQLRCP